jgi:hypothetical protein
MKPTHYRKKLIFEGSVLGELFTRFVNNLPSKVLVWSTRR